LEASSRHAHATHPVVISTPSVQKPGAARWTWGGPGGERFAHRAHDVTLRSVYRLDRSCVEKSLESSSGGPESFKIQVAVGARAPSGAASAPRGEAHGR